MCVLQYTLDLRFFLVTAMYSPPPYKWSIRVSYVFLWNSYHHHFRLPVMGLTKQYLRYAASAVFGVIGSQKANIAYVTLRGGEKGRYVAVAACEQVFIWDVRKGEKVRLCSRYNSSGATVQETSSNSYTLDLNQPPCLCPGPDPAGTETWGDLPLPFTRWHPYRCGIRRWCCENL